MQKEKVAKISKRISLLIMVAGALIFLTSVALVSINYAMAVQAEEEVLAHPSDNLFERFEASANVQMALFLLIVTIIEALGLETPAFVIAVLSYKKKNLRGVGTPFLVFSSIQIIYCFFACISNVSGVFRFCVVVILIERIIQVVLIIYYKKEAKKLPRPVPLDFSGACGESGVHVENASFKAASSPVHFNTAPDSSAGASSRYCPYCGTALSPEATFCGRCGKFLR